MGSAARFGVLLAGLLVGGLVAAAGLWYVSSGETTSVLAALVEQTPTPGVQPTPTLTRDEEKAARKAEKKAQVGTTAARGAFGVIAGVSGNVLSVTDAQGSARTFTLDATTKVFVVGKANALAQDLVIGDKVLVLGAADENVPAPRVVIAVPAAYTMSNVLAGRVTRASATALQVEARDATVTVTLGTTAQVLNAQLATVDGSTLRNKAPVLILGEPNGADAFSAQLVVTLPSGRELQAQRKEQKQAGKLERKEQKQEEKQQRKAGNGKGAGAMRALPNLGAFGTVTTINGNELTMQPEAARNFTLDATTKIIVVGKPNATASDLRQGDKIFVIGGGQNGKRAPTAVLVAPASYAIGNVALGKIQAASETALELKTRLGDVAVTLDAATQLFGDGLETLTASDLEKGRGVVVIGVRGTDGTMRAEVVFMPAGK